MKLFLTVISVLVLCSSMDQENHKSGKSAVQYVCTPCGNSCDDSLFSSPGTCGHCNMPLVERSTVRHKNIRPDELCGLDQTKLIFLDVRTPAEFNGTDENKFGSLKNAINIPVQELEARISELVKYKNNPIVVYCSHSHRSPRASYLLTQHGFTNITNMLEGMSVWKETVKDDQCNSKLYQKQ